MSKIQDALAKIQATRTGESPGDNLDKPGNMVFPIAEVVSVEQGGSDSPEKNEVELCVDRGRLRAAGLLAPENQERHIADQYRLIKRPILDNAKGRKKLIEDNANLVMIASAMPGDGKTFNCINLALSMAVEKDTSVLLVDADVVKPHISRLFAIEDQPGLIDLLLDSDRAVDDVIFRTDIPGLRILPAGQRSEHATELLASRRMGRVVEELSKAYPDRVVIFDSAPLMVTSEAHVLAGLVGQIVFVVCADKTPQQAVLRCIDALDDSKAINLVLNQASDGMASSGYGYGYEFGGYGHEPNA